ncbi:uncharacterized protein J4E92_010109 [Alternaria infectoria]|uniref:uncharacterized protein n=1 Tax=Alternaria infectoria TaxID=45303 RepID=UPI00221F8509|nr:uncharacterized protein J4E92_010109 [Alternaria infectoria]KAI4912258.1 hypothetical protein J4E92_010109 [Alternaria infectoria]
MSFTWDQSTPNIPILGSDEINLNAYKVAAEDDLQYTTFLKDRAKRQDQAYVNSVFRFFSQVHYGLLTWIMSSCASVAKWTAFAPVISKRLDLYTQAHHARGQKLVSENIRMICSDLPKPSDVFVEDEILSGGPRGFPFMNAGFPEFPYISTESMTFWSKSKCQRRRALVSYFSTPISQMTRDIGQYLLDNLWETRELKDAVKNYRGQRGLNPEEAYFIILTRYKQRSRYEWNNRTAIDLVNGLVELNDELHNWQSLLEQQQGFLERLRRDALILEQHYKANPVDPGLEGKGESPTQRVDRALKSVGIRRAEMDKIFHESSRVLEAVGGPDPSNRSTRILT